MDCGGPGQDGANPRWLPGNSPPGFSGHVGQPFQPTHWRMFNAMESKTHHARKREFHVRHELQKVIADNLEKQKSPF